MILRTLAATVMVGSMACAVGCVAVAAGAGAAAGVGTYAYVTGKLTATLDAPIERSHAAAVKASKDLGFTQKTASVDAFQGVVEAVMADGTDVTINLEKKAEDLTEVRIRVGVFGDEHKSAVILEEIRKNL